MFRGVSMIYIKNFCQKYKHLFPLAIFLIFYLTVFGYVENRPIYHMHLLASRFDHLIPFCEVFIIPYIIWFFYITFGVLFFGLVEKDRDQYYQLSVNLMIGMALFLLISLVWPNGHTLRPAVFPRDNVFTRLVIMIYSSDTSTNVFPSIHVFNTIAMHTAVRHSVILKKYPWAQRISGIIAISIVLSTMFIKQHTVIDVVGAMGLNLITWYLLYRQPQFLTYIHSRRVCNRMPNHTQRQTQINEKR